MAKNSVADWDGSTAGNNTDIGGISIAENATAVSDFNNALREMMKQIKAGIGVSFQAYDADTAKLDTAQSWTAVQTFTAQPVFSAVSSNAQIKLQRTTTSAGSAFLGANDTNILVVSDSGGTSQFTVGTDGSISSFGGQIAFPATQSASSDANTLDDYEEGTFTPIIKGSTSAGVGTYASQAGHYTKIGDRIDFKLAVAWTNHQSGTGNLVAGGLPFNARSVNNRSVLSLAFTNLSLTANNYAVAFKSEGNADCSIEQLPVGGGAISGVPLDTAATILLTGTYWV